MSYISKIAGAVLVLAALLGIALWTGAPRFGGESSTKRVQIGAFATAIDYAPYYIAKNKGWIDEALANVGAEPEYRPTFQSLPSVNEAMGAGRLDIVFTGEIPTLIGRAAGIDIKIAWLSARLNADTVIPTRSTAMSIADLKGTRIAVLAGTAPYYWVIRNLQEHGLSKQDVTILDMPPPDAKAAFETAAVDAWAIFPPWAEQEIIAGKAKVLPGFRAPIQVVASVRGRFATEQPATLTAFLGALDRAKEWLQQNPEEAQALVQQEVNIPLPVVRLSWTKLDWSARYNVTQSQETANFLKEDGLVKNIVDVRDLLLSSVRRQ